MSSSETKAPRPMRKRPNSSGEAPGKPANPLADPSLRTPIVRRLDDCHLFQQAVNFGEGSNTGSAMLKAFLQHLPRLQAKKDVVKLVCVAPESVPVNTTMRFAHAARVPSAFPWAVSPLSS